MGVRLSQVLGDRSSTTVGALGRDWLRSIRRSKQPNTVRAYGYAVAALESFLVETGMPTEPAAITREHIDEYLDYEVRRNSPATSRLRRTYLSVFFAWLIDEGEVKVNPVTRTQPAKVQDRPPDVLTDEQWHKLLATSNGTNFDDRRDAAILRVLESSGMRRAECAGLAVGDLDLDTDPAHAVVRGKGDRIRLAPLDDDTVTALRRYLRKRPDEGKDPSARLWLSRAGGGLSGDGIAGVVRRRGADAGLTTHAHQLRHRFAHTLKSAGISEEEIMALGGWRNRASMEQYARSTTSARALDSFAKLRNK